MFEDKEIVVFDLDGTLVDIALDWEVIRRRLLENFPGAGIDPHDSTTTVITEKIAKAFGQGQTQKAYRMISEFERGCSITPVEKTITVARELKAKGKKLAVLSNNCHETIEECLQKAGIREIFDFICGKEDVEMHKPNPDGLHKIMGHFGVGKEKVAFIGNEKMDAETGKSAGIKTVLVQDL